MKPHFPQQVGNKSIQSFCIIHCEIYKRLEHKMFSNIRTSPEADKNHWLKTKAKILSVIFFYGQAEGEATLKEMRSLRERLSNSERTVDALKSNMSSMVTQRDQVHSELHQARLQVAQLTLQLADCSLALREGRARWAQERQAMQRDMEVPSCSTTPGLSPRRLW